jgi:hypothetical protein
MAIRSTALSVLAMGRVCVGRFPERPFEPLIAKHKRHFLSIRTTIRPAPFKKAVSVSFLLWTDLKDRAAQARTAVIGRAKEFTLRIGYKPVSGIVSARHNIENMK